MTTPTHLLWLDIETTDSDPSRAHAAILEIGAIITTWDHELTEVARSSIVVRPAGAQPDHDLMWNRMPPVVRDMHTANGLWREATSSQDAWSITDADDGISRWVTSHVGDGSIPIGGSGVGHLDIPFVKAFMPRLASRLTYWPLDIGNVRRSLQLAGRDDLVDLVTDVDAKPHRALADIELHVAEARRYLRLIRQIPSAQPAAPELVGGEG